MRGPDQHGSPDRVDDGRGDEGEEIQAHEPSEEVIEQRELEDVEPDVLSEQGIVHPEGCAVEKQHQVLPLAGAGQRGKEAEEKGDRQDQKLQGLPVGRHVDRVSVPDEMELRRQAVGQGEVQKEEQEVGDAEQGGRLELRREADREDALVADFLEPEPVRDQAGQPPEGNEQPPQREGHDEAPRQSCRRPDGADVDHVVRSPVRDGVPAPRPAPAHYRGSSGGCQGDRRGS